MSKFNKLITEITKREMNAIDVNPPVIIDSNGDYTSRDGRKVTINSFEDNLDTNKRFWGHIWQKGKYGKLFRRTETWHRNGKSQFVDETPTDIVKKGYDQPITKTKSYINKDGIKRDWLILHKNTYVGVRGDSPDRYNWVAYSKDEKNGSDRVLNDASAAEAKSFAQKNGLVVMSPAILSQDTLDRYYNPKSK